MNENARAVAESGIPLVEVIDADRNEFARGLWTQGYDRDRADRLAASLSSNDAALQMLARHRIETAKQSFKSPQWAALQWAQAAHCMCGCEQALDGTISSHTDLCTSMREALRDAPEQEPQP